jgi:D-serine deaminase-like pyridoxal phosphate-dependent protein
VSAVLGPLDALDAEKPGEDLTDEWNAACGARLSQCDHEDAILDRLSDQHGMIAIAPNRNRFEVGDRVRIVPNSHTVVCNQFAEVYGGRYGTVEAVLPVAARRMMQ